jgi:hypothetical protein
VNNIAYSQFNFLKANESIVNISTASISDTLNMFYLTSGGRVFQRSIPSDLSTNLMHGNMDFSDFDFFTDETGNIHCLFLETNGDLSYTKRTSNKPSDFYSINSTDSKFIHISCCVSNNVIYFLGISEDGDLWSGIFEINNNPRVLWKKDTYNENNKVRKASLINVNGSLRIFALSDKILYSAPFSIGSPIYFIDIQSSLFAIQPNTLKDYSILINNKTLFIVCTNGKEIWYASMMDTRWKSFTDISKYADMNNIKISHMRLYILKNDLKLMIMSSNPNEFFLESIHTVTINQRGTLKFRNITNELNAIHPKL